MRVQFFLLNYKGIIFFKKKSKHTTAYTKCNNYTHSRTHSLKYYHIMQGTQVPNYDM